jgi:hypothetical protein
MAKSSLDYAIHRNIVHAMQKPILLCRPYFPELKLREKRLRYPELQRHAAKQKTRVLRGLPAEFLPQCTKDAVAYATHFQPPARLIPLEGVHGAEFVSTVGGTGTNRGEVYQIRLHSPKQNTI